MTTEQIESLIIEFELGQEYFVWKMQLQDASLTEEAKLKQFYESVILNEHIIYEDDQKVLALMEYTGDNWEDCQDNSDYLVLTNEEAEEKLDQRLEDYLDDNILYGLDRSITNYFDREAWKADNCDDRGSWISTTDGCENEEIIKSTTYYIYKI